MDNNNTTNPIDIEEIIQPQQDQSNTTSQSSTNTSIEELSKQILELQEQLKEEKDKYIRILAEYQNYQRRNEDEKKQLLVYGPFNLLKNLLPTLDNLNKAFENVSNPMLEQNSVLQGLLHVKRDLEKVLKDNGLQKIETENKTFDINMHEAISTAPGENNIIIKELESGYMFHNKVVRQAKVIVGNGIDPEIQKRQEALLRNIKSEFE